MLNETRLAGTIKQAYQEVNAAGLTEGAGLDLFCQKLAQAIVAEVKQLKVNYTTGLTAPNGPVSGTLNHTVS